MASLVISMEAGLVTSAQQQGAFVTITALRENKNMLPLGVLRLVGASLEMESNYVAYAKIIFMLVFEDITKRNKVLVVCVYV